MTRWGATHWTSGAGWPTYSINKNEASETVQTSLTQQQPATSPPRVSFSAASQSIGRGFSKASIKSKTKRKAVPDVSDISLPSQIVKSPSMPHFSKRLPGQIKPPHQGFSSQTAPPPVISQANVQTRVHTRTHSEQLDWVSTLLFGGSRKPPQTPDIDTPPHRLAYDLTPPKPSNLSTKSAYEIQEHIDGIVQKFEGGNTTVLGGVTKIGGCNGFKHRKHRSSASFHCPVPDVPSRQHALSFGRGMTRSETVPNGLDNYLSGAVDNPGPIGMPCSDSMPRVRAPLQPCRQMPTFSMPPPPATKPVSTKATAVAPNTARPAAPKPARPQAIGHSSLDIYRLVAAGTHPNIGADVSRPILESFRLTADMQMAYCKMLANQIELLHKVSAPDSDARLRTQLEPAIAQNAEHLESLHRMLVLLDRLHDQSVQDATAELELAETR